VSFSQRPPLTLGGGRPSIETLSKFGRWRKALPKKLAEGDIILYQCSAYSVVKKASQIYRGSYITLRELVTHSIRQVRIEPHVWLERLDMDETVSGLFTGTWARWKPAPGDVVFYSALDVLAIRHSQGWFRTEAPWCPVQDAEVAHDLIEGQAMMVRSHLRRLAADPEGEFVVGSMVATRNLNQPDPSVWFRKSHDYWVTNSRGVALSDQMIRYELRRGVYQVLWLPED
jgi:hypothetical protein